MSPAPERAFNAAEPGGKRDMRLRLPQPILTSGRPCLFEERDRCECVILSAKFSASNELAPNCVSLVFCGDSAPCGLDVALQRFLGATVEMGA